MKHNITLIITFVALILSVYFFQKAPYFIALILAILSIYLFIVILGTSFIKLNYFVKNINHGSKTGVSLTFDDGPDAEITPKILTILAQENVKATFFVIGHKIENNEALLLRIHNEGHTIGNHSFNHNKKLTILSTNKLKADIVKCSLAIEKIICQTPHFFRPPFGITTPRYKRALLQLNMKTIGWSIRSLDTVIKNELVLHKKITHRISKGNIVLFHDTQKVTLAILPKIIHFCKENGMNIVSLTELTNEKDYD